MWCPVGKHTAGNLDCVTHPSVTKEDLAGLVGKTASEHAPNLCVRDLGHAAIALSKAFRTSALVVDAASFQAMMLLRLFTFLK